jgi:inward rectifier potassium channel
MKTTRASQQNTGLGTNANNYGGRFINKDGTANESEVCFLLHRISWYHTMIDMPMAFHVYPVVLR